MKIDFLESGSPDCPLVRIYGQSIPEFKILHATIRQLADGSIDLATVEDLSGYESTDGTSLILTRGSKSVGFIRTENQFELRVTEKEWETIAYLIEPFLERIGGCQWLWESMEDPIMLLLSSAEGGAW